MKKIAIFNDFQKPVPAIAGGSVPILTNFLIDENEKENKYQFDVYSCYDSEAEKVAKKYKNTNFIFFKDARRIRFLTNLKFVLNNKIHTTFDLSQIPLPKSAKKFFEKENYDAVYVNGYIRGALPIMNISKAPVIIHHHVVTDILAEGSINGKGLLDRCKKMLFVSEFAAQFTKGASAVEKKKMSAFFNAIDTSRFQFDHSEKVRSEVRCKYGIREEDKVVLFVGRMVANKGALELIQAFNQCEFGKNVKLLIVGGETYDSNKVTNYVRRCLEESRKNSNIILTGYIPYSDIPQYYIASDIATLLSRCNEACGLVGIEAMAAGLPIITTNRGGIGEYISEECKIITPDDENLIESTVKALRKLINDKELCIKMGNAGINRAKDFDKVGYFKRFEKIMDEVIENGENV